MEWASLIIVPHALMHHLTSIQTIPSEPLKKLDILGRGTGGAKHTTKARWPLALNIGPCG